MHEFTYAYGAVVVYAGLLGCLKLGIGALCYPQACQLFVIKPDGTYGTCGVTIGADFTAGSIGTQQAACGLFLKMECSFHIYSLLR